MIQLIRSCLLLACLTLAANTHSAASGECPSGYTPICGPESEGSTVFTCTCKSGSSGSGESSLDPLCLVWDIDGGSVSENPETDSDLVLSATLPPGSPCEIEFELETREMGGPPLQSVSGVLSAAAPAYTLALPTTGQPLVNYRSRGAAHMCSADEALSLGLVAITRDSASGFPLALKRVRPGLTPVADEHGEAGAPPFVPPNPVSGIGPPAQCPADYHLVCGTGSASNPVCTCEQGVANAGKDPLCLIWDIQGGDVSEAPGAQTSLLLGAPLASDSQCSIEFAFVMRELQGPPLLNFSGTLSASAPTFEMALPASGQPLLRFDAHGAAHKCDMDEFRGFRVIARTRSSGIEKRVFGEFFQASFSPVADEHGAAPAKPYLNPKALPPGYFEALQAGSTDSIYVAPPD